jgi:hypothetical protein
MVPRGRHKGRDHLPNSTDGLLRRAAAMAAAKALLGFAGVAAACDFADA